LYAYLHAALFEASSNLPTDDAIFLFPTYNLSIANIDLNYITNQCSSSLIPRQRQKQFAPATPGRVRGESVLYWRVSDTDKDTDRRG